MQICANAVKTHVFRARLNKKCLDVQEQIEIWKKFDVLFDPKPIILDADKFLGTVRCMPAPDNFYVQKTLIFLRAEPQIQDCAESFFGILTGHPQKEKEKALILSVGGLDPTPRSKVA